MSSPGRDFAVLLARSEPLEPSHSHGLEFFRSFRDLVATGFWTSKMGIEDLQFMGNVFVHEFNGCPEAVLTKLGLI